MTNDPRAQTGTDTGNMRHGAERMGEQARSMARDMASEARHQASDLADQAREQAMHGVSRAREEVERRASEGVHYGADQVSSTARALRRAGDDVEGTFQGQLLHQAADGLAEISDGIRGRTIGEIAGNLADFGRRNPAAFLGGAALTGFALARFARASHRDDNRHDGPYPPATTGRGAPNPPVRPATSYPPATGVTGATGTAAGATSPTGGPVSPSGPGTPLRGSDGAGSAHQSTAGGFSPAGGPGRTTPVPGSDPDRKGNPDV